jgi:two-component system cell cycle sensor histidine kinase/response regulator CckA
MDKKSLRVLLVEDNPHDAELILRALRGAGFAPDWQRVDTEEEFSRRLDPHIDIVLSDYVMPEFSGPRALELLKERGLGLPFIIISGTIGEETAVEAMRSGAADYLLKDRLGRLGEAVKRALEEKRLRQEREEAKEALGFLQRQSELILKSAGEGIYGLDLEGNINFINPKAAELLGWKAEELLGKPAHATLHYKRPDGSDYSIDDCPIHGGAPKAGTRRVTGDLFWRKDGSSFRVDYVAAPLKDKSGQVGGSIVTFTDATEQFAAEARLKLQEQQYRLLFQTNPNPMWVFDTKTFEILAVNDAAVSQYGYSREQFLKLTLRDLRPAEDMVDLTKSLSPSNAPAHFSGEFRHVRKDGSPIRVEIYSSPIVWDGSAARIVTAIDITQRKQAEERLREQADIINRAHDIVVIRNFSDDRIMFWNSGAERVYGWSAAEAMGQPMGELIFADESGRAALVEQLLETGEFHGEIKHRTKDGRDVIVNSRATLIRNDDGTPRSVLGIGTDVTDQKNLETQLLRAQRLESIGTLASGVAHDLNNILTPIMMCAEVLRQKPSEEDASSSIALIEESARRGASIVKQVLTFARGVEGERVLIKPSHLIEEMVDIARKTFPKSIEISGRYPDDLWSIKGDPTQLHQVLLNLSVNARDAMPNGGSLVVWAENFTVDEHFASMTPEARVGQFVALRVSDTGTGMPRAMIDKIFDPFFTTKEVGKGTGLGLSTVLGIVKSHGGFVSVYSEQGKGTAFKLFLPATVTHEELEQSKSSVVPIQGNGELILVVDDEPNILGITKMILEKHHYDVLLAGDGPEALAIFAQRMQSIRLVLTDVSMPYMDGAALARALKKMKSDLPIIASTGQGEQAGLADFEALGVKNILAKPYNTQQLLATVRDTLQEKAE